MNIILSILLSAALGGGVAAAVVVPTANSQVQTVIPDAEQSDAAPGGTIGDDDGAGATVDYGNR